MINNEELRKLTLIELEEELLKLRKEQFMLRMKKANGTLDKQHPIGQLRRAIARVKTITTEKGRMSHVE